ncbi:MAG: hypothetical protein Q8N18_13395 [Opitutaceae bacterium]|nr:hypothetical protein [Opitutaceae bacterium]
MTTRAKIAHWITIGCLAYCAGLYVANGLEKNWIDAFAITFWSFLAFMVYQRPKSWGFWVGLFLLFVIPIQTWLWQLAVTRLSPEQKAAQGVNESWAMFSLSVLPLVAGGICGIALRWVCPAQEKQPQA